MPSSSMVKASLTAVGWSFTEVTLMTRVSLSDSAPPVPVAVIVASVITIVTVILTEGWNRAAAAAILGTVAALLVTGVLSSVVSAIAGFSAAGSTAGASSTAAGSTGAIAVAPSDPRVLYVGTGVSGGEEGALWGPSIMPGGSPESYAALAPILKAIAAKSDYGDCVSHIGPRGSGHYVKMVHNGIEYGDMQLIAEAYDALKTLGGLSNDELADTFAKWNEGELQSFIIEITARIFKQKDDKGDGRLVDQILDATGMKGTGKWTVQDASDL